MTSAEESDAAGPEPEQGAAVSRATDQPVRAGWRKLGLLILAGVFFVLSVLGVLLPVLPATPFLLLTSYFLVRSSPTLNARLLRSRMFGPILTDWQVHGGVRNHVRWKAVILVTATIGVTLAVAGYSTLMTGTVGGLAAIGILVILKLPAANEGLHADDSLQSGDEQ